MTGTAGWDAFVSHAWEDKASFVRPLAEALANLGANLWYDEFELKLGMSLSEEIDRGLASCPYGLVVLSPHFMTKAWPRRELQGLVQRQAAGKATILPIWHNVDHAQVLDFSPPLADLIAVRTSEGSAVDIALQVLKAIRPDLYAAHPRAELERRANGEALRQLEAELDDTREHLSEFQCPYCRADMVGRMPAPVDMSERDWDEVTTYECGFEEFCGEVRQPCPSDPLFPAFTDYEIRTDELDPGVWIARGLGRTPMARRVSIRSGQASTSEKAIEELKDNYREWAPARLHDSAT